MNESLTKQQLKFALCVAQGETLSGAYRRAYSGTVAKSKTVHEEASRLAVNPKVSARIAELRAHAAARALERHTVTTDSLLAECDEALGIAKAKDDASAMVSAVKLKAMITGNLVKERDNGRAPLADVTDEVVIAELERLRAERADDRAVH